MPSKTANESIPDGRSNSFDAIRLLLALLVVYSHAYFIGGFGEEGFAHLVKSQTIAGTLAVLGFFGVSGFLVTRFVRARFLRIIPGYYFALLVTAFVLAPLIARFNRTSQPWAAADALHYVYSNLFVRVGSWNIGGVLNGMPTELSINGALWSLYPELCCYAIVLCAGLIGWIRLGRPSVLLVSIGVFVLHAALVVSPKFAYIAPTLFQLTGYAPFVTAFMVGCSAYCFRDHIGIGAGSAVAWTAIVICLLRFGGWSLLGPVALPLAVINVAYSFRFRLRFDLSYGTYVLHYPVLYLMAASGLVRMGYWVYLISSILVTAVLAALSWNLVEKPALGLKEAGS
jgi:peptidoglycan/LPS O-acetylase OafA/YrhL